MDITKKELKQLLQQTIAYIETEAESRGLDVEDHYYQKLSGILTSKSRAEAFAIVKRVKEGHEVHVMLKGKRPRTIKWYEEHIRDALSLAKSMRLKKDFEAMETAEARAGRYRVEMEKLRKEAST